MGGIILYTMALALFNLLMNIAYTYSIGAGPHQLEYAVDIDHVRAGDMARRWGLFRCRACLSIRAHTRGDGSAFVTL